MFLKRILPLLFIVNALLATGKPYWIFLTNEDDAPSVELTSRAEQRIALRGSSSVPGSATVSQSQIASIRSAGYQIRHTSRFLNAISVVIHSDTELGVLQAFPFVNSITPVGKSPLKRLKNISHPGSLDRGSALSYGASEGQNEMLKIPLIHQLGYDASGILIGVFDTGFLTDHPVFDNMDVVAQYDFVDDEVDASGVGHSHGISVLSAIGGNSPGELIGPAYAASYLLARTEDYLPESRAEEDNWVAALEWADSLGVDIISSSLNYFNEFDDSSENYPFSALDGATTIISQAANIAAERGILVVNSAGNEGPGVSSIWPPADSPHVLAVGAVDRQLGITSFSGRGPTYDGRIKPNVVAQGSNVYLASGVNGFTLGNGTSYSTPQIAGLAALLLQAHPQLSPDSVISIFQGSGSRAQGPDNTYGWGIPDITGLFPNLAGRSSRNCLVYPNPGSIGEIRMILTSPVSVLPELATLFDIKGGEIAALRITRESANIIKISIPASLDLASQLLIVSVKTRTENYSGKFIHLR